MSEKLTLEDIDVLADKIANAPSDRKARRIAERQLCFRMIDAKFKDEQILTVLKSCYKGNDPDIVLKESKNYYDLYQTLKANEKLPLSLQGV